MLFNSLAYALFLPATVLLYFALPQRTRAPLLLVASYAFYAYWNPSYLLLILALTAANYLFGLALEPRAGRQRPGILLALAVAANLAVLAFYKYALFLLTSAAAVLGWLGAPTALPVPDVLLPLGISFFTFEFVHYVVDVWKGEPAVRSPLKFALFAAFFPTQVAGPIKRYESFIPQIDLPKTFDWERLARAIDLIARGLAKKMLIADHLARFVGLGFDRPAGAAPLGVVDAWLAAVAFAMQIYFDFSGYTDIGRGSALLFGYEVPENFTRPYLARNVSEFWRRWHVSLSTWLRDYLYIPLGGARRHRYRNLFVTMVLGGLWHGASWTFVVWGAFHGALLAGFWAWRAWRGDREAPSAPSRGDALGAAGAWLGTFALATVGWVFFRATTLDGALDIIGSMLGLHADVPDLYRLHQRFFILGIAAATLAVEWAIEHPSRLVALGSRAFRWAGWSARDDARRLAARLLSGETALAERLIGFRPVVSALLFAAVILGQPDRGPRFIYFQF